ncbi:MAG TPA: hypothetical protein GX529_03035 [Firmicutes bacterium]|nr:hypothetical protein [Candidatus Fermentithermobacillaceae bacterium]
MDYYNLFNWKEETSRELPRMRWFTVVLLVLCLGVFFFTKPNYSYEDGKALLEREQYTEVASLSAKSIASFELKATKMIPRVFLYSGMKDGQRYYLMVHPDTGEIASMTMGEGNYLDFYFERYAK